MFTYFHDELLALVLWTGVLMAGCAPASPPPVLPTEAATQAALPTPPRATATGTSASALFLTDIDMMDERSGWGWSSEPAAHASLLHTSDGGRTWRAAAPDGDLSQALPPYSAYLLDAETAWVIRADDSLVRTQDGGITWTILLQDIRQQLLVPFRDWYMLRFADARHGWLDAGYSAAGAHEFFYRTDDGGMTWSPMNFESWPAELGAHHDHPNELAFWTPIDALYYDLTRFVIVPAEQEEPLRMFVSSDQGHAWKTVRLPPPAIPGPSFAPADRRVSAPTFFDAQHGVLTVSILDKGSNTTRLFVYGTTDGGSSWNLTGGPTTIPDARTAMRFIDARHAVLVCGSRFCATSDGGRTWQARDFGVPVSVDNASTFARLDFVNASTGWLLLMTYSQQGLPVSARLLNTRDGGSTWTELAPAGP